MTGERVAEKLRRLRGVRASDEDAYVSDEALMEQVARGDREAFAALYDRFADRAFGLIRRVLRDPAQSEEVTQEVFVEVWQSARRYDAAQGALAGWLLTIAHRRAVDRVRSEQAARNRAERSLVDQPERPNDVVSEQVEHRLEREQVRKALDQLTDLQREAIELAYYDGNTYREVSELLDVPLGTIKTRLRDGLIRLRDALGVTT